MKDYKSHSDQELWRLIKLNDRYAFEAIYRRHWANLMISAYNLLGDKEACRDILQDVFADLWSRRRTTFIDSLSGYLKVAVRNRVFRHLRNGAITRKHLERLDKIAFVDATEQMVNFNLLKQKYERSVAALPEKCREVFLLSRVENLSIKEIASKLSISPKTVEAQISKALRHLRHTIGDSAIIILTFHILF